MVMSESDPVMMGTRMAMPSNKPFRSGIASVVALAAPVVVGTILKLEARARRISGCSGGGGPSTLFCSAVIA